MAGTPTQRRDTLVAVLLAVVVVSSFVAGAVGLGAAHAKGDHVTRNGDTLRIVVENAHFDTPDRNVTVNAKKGGKVKLTPANKRNGRTIYRVAVSKLSKPRTDLHNATLVVTGKNGTLFTERENLRILTLGKGSNARFTNGGTLLVPVKKALGYAGTTPVGVTLDGSKKAVTGKIRHNKRGAYLTVSLDPKSASLPVSKQAKIRVPGRATTTAPLRKLVRQATEIDRSDGKRVVVTGPTLAADSTYSVSIRSKQPSGRFASTVQTNGQGALTISDSAMANAQTLTVSVYRGGNRAVRKQVSSSDSTAVYQATVLADGSGVKLLHNRTLDAPNATVWLTNGSDYAQLDANVTDNGTVLDFGATNYRLHRNGTYDLILTGGTYARVDVSGTRSMSNSPFTVSKDAIDGATGNESSGGPLSDFGFGGNRMVVFGSLLALVGLVGGGVFVYSRRGGSSSGSARGATAGQTVETHKLTISVDDGGTNGGLDATVTAEEMGTNGASESTRISNGRGTMTLEHGVWYVTAESNGLSERKRVDVSGHSAVDFTLGPQQLRVRVTDDDREPVSSVGVTCATDAGTTKTRKPDSKGRVALNVPLDATEAELSADHEKFEGDEITVSFDQSASVESSLTLRRLTGDLRVSATVDGTPIPGARIEVTPREETVRELGEPEHRARTDDEGTATFEDLLVGRYEIGMAIPSGGRAFRTTSKRVEVRDGSVARESLDASFQYSLDSRDRERIASLRERAESLSSASGRDVAIPRYYGTVVTSLLDAVERVPQQGHRFAAVDEEPDEVVTALLDAAEQTVRLVDDAMTTKRNTDLFGACVDMPDRRVEWTGQFDLDSLFELLEQDRTAQRQTVLEQLRRVDDRIDDERAGLAVVAPAREPWDLTQEFVNSERGGDLVRGAAVAFAAGGLLDAVDELFDHEELRKRLERTVF